MANNIKKFLGYGGAGLAGFGLSKLMGEDEINPYGTLNPEQIAVTKTLGSRLNSLTESPSYYGGKLTEDITPEEQAVVDRYSKLYEGFTPTLSKLGNYDDAAFNEQFRTEMVEPSYDIFTRYSQPLIEEALPTLSTERGKQVTAGLSDLSNSLLQQRYAGREAAKNRSLTAMGEARSMGDAAYSMASIPRVIKQAGLDRAYDAYVKGNSEYQNYITDALNFLGISTGTIKEDNTLETMLAILKAGGEIATAAA